MLGSGRNDLGGEQTGRPEHKGMSAAWKTLPLRNRSAGQAGSRPTLELGKADDAEEETGTSTLWNRRSMGPGIAGKIRRITSGRSRWQQGLVATCKDSSNEAKAEGEESHAGLTHETVRAKTEE